MHVHDNFYIIVSQIVKSQNAHQQMKGTHKLGTIPYNGTKMNDLLITCNNMYKNIYKNKEARVSEPGLFLFQEILN